MKRVQKWMDKAVNAVFGLAVLFVLYVLAQIFLFAAFKIPSDSMKPTLIEGDVISVCKPALGARIFNIWASLKGEEVAVYRLPGFSKVRRDDVLVFNFPYPDWDKWDEDMRMNISNYYVKRCVAVPGDTLFIHDGIYMVGDRNILAGNIESQKRIMKFNPDNIPDDQYYTFPFDSIVRWNIREFGPFYIPGKNDSIPMNRTNYLLYRKIVWEQDEDVQFLNGKVYLGNKELDGYRFKSNYYFMSGDNSMNSVDSRFWGLIPEDFIVGKAGFVITSRSRNTGKIRWNRVLKKIE